MFIAMQLVGGLAAFAFVSYVYPTPTERTSMTDARLEVLFVCVHNADPLRVRLR